MHKRILGWLGENIKFLYFVLEFQLILNEKKKLYSNTYNQIGFVDTIVSIEHQQFGRQGPTAGFT